VLGKCAKMETEKGLVNFRVNQNRGKCRLYYLGDLTNE